MKPKNTRLYSTFMGIWVALLCSVMMISLATISRAMPDGVNNLPIVERYGTATSVEWNSDSTMLAIGGSQGVWLYDESFHQIQHFSTYPDDVGSITWSSDGTHIAADSRGSRSSRTWVWDIGSQESVTYPAPSYIPIEWQPDGNLIAYGTYPGEVFVLDTTMGEQQLIYQQPTDWGNVIHSALVCWFPDGKRLIAQFIGGIYIFDVSTREVINKFSVGSDTGGSCSPDRKHLVSPWGTLVDLETGNYSHLSESEFIDGYAASWSADGKRIAINSSQRQVQIYDVQQAEHIITLEGGMVQRTGIIIYYDDSITWSPDNKWLAAAGEDGTVRIWDSTNYELAVLMDNFEPSPYYLDFQDLSES